MFTSPLLYHHSLPTVRTATDPKTGRRFSFVDSGVHNYPYRSGHRGRRNTIAVVTPSATAGNETAATTATGASARQAQGGDTEEAETANTTYAQDKELDPNEPVFRLRRSSFEAAPGFSKGGSMSKVVRGVKNITKGYSSVQVKVRNGMSDSTDAWATVAM